MPSALAARTKARKSASVPRSGWTASWPPSADADGPGRPGVARLGVERVVASLAVEAPDRVDRREVEHVETHRRDRGDALGSGAEGAALDRAVLVQLGALGPREELVPGPDSRALALDQQLAGLAERHQRRERAVGEVLGDRVIADDLECGLVGHGAVTQAGGGIRQHAALGERPRLLGDRALEQPRSHLTHERGIDPGLDLEVGGVLPGGEVVAEGLEPERPDALLERRDERRPAVEAVVERSKPVQRLVTGGREQPHVHADADRAPHGMPWCGTGRPRLRRPSGGTDPRG